MDLAAVIDRARLAPKPNRTVLVAPHLAGEGERASFLGTVPYPSDAVSISATLPLVFPSSVWRKPAQGNSISFAANRLRKDT